MKRFIDLGDQIYAGDGGAKEFAFFDTTTLKFEIHNGTSTWQTKEDFIEDYEGTQLQRYLSLIPSDWANSTT